jgi:hypothetical protein
MNQKLLTGLIVLVAVVVIGESLVIISRLNPNQKFTLLPTPTTQVTPMATTTDGQFSLTTTSAWTKGSAQTVTVAFMANRDISLDALDLYVKYDPAKVTVTKLNFPQLKPTLSKISAPTGLALANYLITDTSGLKLLAGSELPLMTLSVTPKVSGAIQFEVATGQSTSGSTTMIIENETSKALSFDSIPLTVNAQ